MDVCEVLSLVKFFHHTNTLSYVTAEWCLFTVLCASEFRWFDQWLFRLIWKMNSVASRVTSIEQHCRHYKTLKFTFALIVFGFFIAHKFMSDGNQSNQCPIRIQYEYHTLKWSIISFLRFILLYVDIEPEPQNNTKAPKLDNINKITLNLDDQRSR